MADTNYRVVSPDNNCDAKAKDLVSMANSKDLVS